MPKQTVTKKKEQSQTSSQQESFKIISVNRQAYHEYTVERTLEAGISLVGTEIKSVRQGKIALRGSYAVIRKGEIWMENAHIAAYEHGSYSNHDPMRSRKLLLHKREITQLTERVAMKGLTLIPLKFYLKGGRAKIELGVCRGRKFEDKREALKEREVKRDIERIMRSRGR